MTISYFLFAGEWNFNFYVNPVFPNDVSVGQSCGELEEKGGEA